MKDLNITNIAVVVFATLALCAGIFFILDRAGYTKVSNSDQVINDINKLTSDENTELQSTGDVDSIQSETLSAGTGDRVIQTGDTVLMHYRGTLLDGTAFDNSYDRGQPYEFTVGAGEVIVGWDEGVLGMKVGEKRKITIPSAKAYGESGYPPTIPPKSALVFELELVEIK